MSAVKWAPGPWTCEEVVPEDKDWGMCEITAQDDSFVATAVLGVANARLISAAPDMYEALAYILSDVEPTYFALSETARDKAELALAKARGEKP